jgi:1,2-dihydroxy-3-keto-5-methylthiopentene dioxygenase
MRLNWLDSPDATPAPTLEDLLAVGVHYEQLEVGSSGAQASLNALKSARGYLVQDEVKLTPTTDNLEQICDKFKDEHLHTEDEVRFVLEGEGVFEIRAADERWLRVFVESGDLLVVPANLYHRFFLTDRKHIHCARLFKDPAGWVAHYRDTHPQN